MTKLVVKRIRIHMPIGPALSPVLCLGSMIIKSSDEWRTSQNDFQDASKRDFFGYGWLFYNNEWLFDNVEWYSVHNSKSQGISKLCYRDPPQFEKVVQYGWGESPVRNYVAPATSGIYKSPRAKTIDTSESRDYEANRMKKYQGSYRSGQLRKT